MGVYEERAPPTTGMHWVSVIPLFALPIGRRANPAAPYNPCAGSESRRERAIASTRTHISPCRIQDGEQNRLASLTNRRIKFVGRLRLRSDQFFSIFEYVLILGAYTFAHSMIFSLETFSRFIEFRRKILENRVIGHRRCARSLV